MVSSKVVENIYEMLKANQESGRWESGNYVSNIVKNLGYCRKTVHDGLKTLENMNVIDKRRKGRRKIIKLVDFDSAVFDFNKKGRGRDENSGKGNYRFG